MVGVAHALANPWLKVKVTTTYSSPCNTDFCEIYPRVDETNFVALVNTELTSRLFFITVEKVDFVFC